MFSKFNNEQLCKLSQRFWERAHLLMNRYSGGQYSWDWLTFNVLFPRHTAYYQSLWDEAKRRELVKEAPHWLLGRH